MQAKIQMNIALSPNAQVTRHAIVNRSGTKLTRGTRQEFVKNKVREERPAKGKGKGKSDMYDYTDDKDDKCPVKKPTLDINCIYGQKARNSGQKRNNSMILRLTALKNRMIEGKINTP